MQGNTGSVAAILNPRPSAHNAPGKAATEQAESTGLWLAPIPFCCPIPTGQPRTTLGPAAARTRRSNHKTAPALLPRSLTLPALLVHRFAPVPCGLRIPLEIAARTRPQPPMLSAVRDLNRRTIARLLRSEDGDLSIGLHAYDGR